MITKNGKKQIYNELKDLILSTDRDKLLPALKDKFRYAAVEDRTAYKQELLKLAQEPDIEPFHSPIFETLASLTPIWLEHLPRRGLIQKFNQLYDTGKYEEAARICSDLTTQGLDYLDTIDIGEGDLHPLYDENKPEILQFNEREIRILDLDLNLTHQVDIPQDQRIIDVLTPYKYSPYHHEVKDSELNDRIWLLAEDRNSSHRSIIPLDKDKKTLDLQAKIGFPGKHVECIRLSRFQGHLLLVGEKSIFCYRPDQGWTQWLTIEDKITCFEQIDDHYWIGSADGHLRIIHKFEHMGVRTSLDIFTTFVTGIGSHEKIAAAASEKKLTVATPEGVPKMGPITNESPIHQIILLNNEVIVILQKNGRLLARETRHGNILWQVNLEDRYDSLLNIGKRVYCKREKGPVSLFVFPEIQVMTHSLKSHGITVTEVAMEKDPTAPVQDWIDFHGRELILENIKKNPQTCFFITGAPKSGKSSLLYILNDVLSSNSRCCYIDIEKINNESSSYDEFERKLYERCLSQHGIILENLGALSIFQKLTVLVNKVRGTRDYCAFCLDNFILPEFSDKHRVKEFSQLVKEMFVINHVRLIITCCKKKQKENERYFKDIRSTAAKDKEIRQVNLTPFSEEEAKIAIRKIGRLSELQQEEIYHYTDGFPHLIRHYHRWDTEKTDIETYSLRIARENKDKIFAYFRDLSPNACLLLATLLFKNLVSKKINFDKIYNDFPLLAEFITRANLKNIFEEISEYSNEFKVEYDDDHFKVEIGENPRLFYLASLHIPWIKVLFALFQFSANPNRDNAQQIILAYRDLINIPIEDEKKSVDTSYDRFKDQFKNQFYIRKMSPEARDALKIPLITFIVIPINPWIKGKTIQDFSSLYASLQEYVRRLRKSSGIEGAAAKFYVVLFSFIGTSSIELKEEMIGLERVSIIDTQDMREVLLAEKPAEMTRSIIFKQLKISERSPYISAGPVEELFYGRDIEIALVRGLPENIGIFGTRTIGKTSLMLKLYRDLKDRENWRVFALDCGMIDNEKKLLTTLAENMDIPFKKISNIRKFKRNITQSAEQDRVKYLFLLDEVDSLVAYDVKHGEKIFKTFNSLCIQPLKSEGTAARFVLFGFEEMFNQMKNPKSRLYNFMVFLPLKSLDLKSALALVTRPMENIFVKWQSMEDAQYLVEQSSGHPWLLQAVCHTLLKILDQKAEKFDIVERENVNQALIHDDFRQLCMRPYESISRLDKEHSLQGIYKITTLAALILHLEKDKELFSLNDIQKELKNYGLDILPDRMHAIIIRLCMYGVFRYLGDPDIIMQKEKNKDKIVELVKKEIPKASEMKIEIPEKIKVSKPEIFDISKGYNLEFKYQFAVKIFPQILAANFGGLENCKIVIKETVKRKK